MWIKRVLVFGVLNFNFKHYIASDTCLMDSSSWKWCNTIWKLDRCAETWKFICTSCSLTCLQYHGFSFDNHNYSLCFSSTLPIFMKGKWLPSDRNSFFSFVLRFHSKTLTALSCILFCFGQLKWIMQLELGHGN